MARPLEDEFSYFQQLLVIGKERGYLLYDEVNVEAKALRKLRHPSRSKFVRAFCKDSL